MLDAVEQRGESGRRRLQQGAGGGQESPEAPVQGAPAVGGARAVDPSGGAAAELGGRVEVEQDPYGQGGALHHRRRGGGQVGEGLVRAQAQVVGGGPVGEGHEGGRVGGVLAPGEAGQAAHGRFEEVTGESRGGLPGRGGGTGQMAAVEGLQEV